MRKALEDVRDSILCRTFGNKIDKDRRRWQVESINQALSSPPSDIIGELKKVSSALAQMIGSHGEKCPDAPCDSVKFSKEQLSKLNRILGEE